MSHNMYRAHSQILTELPLKFNLKPNCESLLLGILPGMSCEQALWTRWSPQSKREKKDNRNEKADAELPIRQFGQTN